MFSTYRIFPNNYSHLVIICDLYNHLFESFHFSYLIIFMNNYGYQQVLLFFMIYGPNMISNFIKLYMDGFLTQWAFHRVQEHSNRSWNKEVMTSEVGGLTGITSITRLALPDQSCPTGRNRPVPAPNALHMHMAEIVTQWAFH